jgi:glycosyltransferase involved in cell wall biosynthesis
MSVDKAALQPGIVAIIPTYAEERFIESVIQEVRQYLEQVIVVDDGSPDRTAELAEKAGATVMRHSDNRGKGAAIQTGLQHPVALAAEYLLLMDGDGQHDPRDIPKLIEAIANSQNALVVGNRMNDLSKMPWARRLTNRFMSWQISALCGQQLPDSQCGFRILNQALRPLLLKANTGFDFETEMLLLAAKNGYQISFIPIRTIYRDEQSKIRPIRDTLRYFRLIARYWLT